MDEAAEKKLFHLQDKRQSTTVEFWMRTFVAHVEAMSKASSLSDETLKAFKRFLRYTTRLLEMHDDYNVIGYFEPLWQRLKVVNADLLGEVTHVLIQMWKQPQEVDPDTMKIEDFEVKRFL